MRNPLCNWSVVAAAFLGVSARSYGEGSWEQLAPLPQSNGGFIAGAIGERVLVAGGTTWEDDKKLWLDQVWVFDPARNRWTNNGRLPTAQAYAVCGSRGGELYFAGGSSGIETNGNLFKFGRYLDLRFVGASELRTVYACGGVIDNRLYLVGGAPAQDQLSLASNAAYAVDLDTGASTRLPDVPLPSLAIATAAACNGRLFVFAGARWDSSAGAVENVDTIFEFAPSRNEWTKLASYPYAARGVTAAAIGDKHIYVGGGYKNDTEEFTSDAFVFDAEKRELRASVPLPIRAMVHLVVAGDYLYCLGGEDRKKHRSDAVFRIPLSNLLEAGSARESQR